MAGPDTIVSHRVVDLSEGVEPGVIRFFKDRAIDYVVDSDGNIIGQWEYNYTPKGVVTACIAAFATDKKMILVYRHRAGADWIYELPGGDTRGSESSEQAALRELREETGYTTNDPLVLLSRGYVSAAHTNVPMHIYYASNCEQTHASRLDSMECSAGLEAIAIHPRDVILRMDACDGYFNDGIARAILVLQARELIAF